MKNVKFYNYYQGKTDIISVEMLVDDIEGESMDKLADNRMINKIEKLLQEARTHVAVEVNNTLLRTYMEIGKLLVVNNPVPVSLLSGGRKPQIRFLGNHHSGSGNLYHKSFRM